MERELENEIKILINTEIDAREAKMLAMIESTVAQAVIKTMENHPQYCRFPSITPEQAAEVGHALGMMKDIGDGDIGRGVELIRRNHKTIDKWIVSQEYVSKCVQRTTIGVFVLGVIGLVVMGLREWIKRGG